MVLATSTGRRIKERSLTFAEEKEEEQGLELRKLFPGPGLMWPPPTRPTTA